MKKLPVGGSFIRGLAASFAIFACVSVAKAHPYASCLTNFVVSGSNGVSFYLNEGGGTVTATTYPSVTTISMGVLPSGATNFVMPLGDTNYSISVTKTGTGTPTQVSTDIGWNIWNAGMTLRAVGVNTCAQYGDAFGRVYLGATGQTATEAQLPAYRAWGVYAITPDLTNNAIYGGTNPLPAIGVLQSNTFTINVPPTNGQVFRMDGATLTWTNNATLVTQIPTTNTIGASATNLAAALNANLALYPTTISVFATSNVVTALQYAQTTPGDPYYSYSTAGLFGPFANDFLTGDNGFGSGPYRIEVNPADGTVWVTDATIGNAQIYFFGRNIDSTNQIWTVTGLAAGEAALEHGYPADIAFRGSVAQGNFQIFTAELDMGVPTYFNNTNFGTLGNGGIGNFGGAQETVVGDQNEIMRYDLSNAVSYASFPVTNTPVWSCTLGLDGANFGGQVCSVALGPNTNYVYAGFRRLNASDGNVQVFNSVTGARVYTSLAGTPQAPTDIFATDSDGGIGCYGVHVSPDGRYLAALYADSQVAVVNLTNGLPDVSTIFIITNGGPSTTARQMCWDAADNLYIQQTTAIEREWSLGLSTTCVTSNDVTGTNGSFQLIVPPADVTVANAGNASQDYGTPLTGNINVNAGTTTLSSPVTVNFKIAGTGVNEVNYNIIPGTDVHGVIVATNAGGVGTITFPGTGVFPGGGNWNGNIQIVPTATPLIGPSLTVTISLLGGSTYIKGSPGTATVTISNTGPQLFFVAAATNTTTMSRAISNDYAEFVITRWGDLQGPGNSFGSVTPKTITLTNFTLKGTAVFPTDYTAGVQPFVPGQVPQNGSASVAFAPGVASQVVLVGNPVSHANALQPPTNVTIIPTLTNSVTGTNGTSGEGFGYFVTTASTTLTEFDNAEGTLAEVVIWSDPLTNSAGANYAVTFAAGSFATNSVLPAYIPNYQYTNGGANNGSGAALGAPSNYFDVQLGFPITNENTFENASGTIFPGPAYANPPPSGVMAAHGWSNVLRMTVDKDLGQNPTQCGLNFFPTTNQFFGNYALRFDMYLSVWSGALNNLAPLTFPRNFAAFGINTLGTNDDWRVNLPQGFPNANNPTNADGIWYAIDAGDSSLTPADFDGFASPALPNNGTSDFVSSTAGNENGVFKRPPFPVTDGVAAGTPINNWTSISVEQRQTNVALLVDSTAIFPNLGITNNATSPPNNFLLAPSGLWSNGVPMLGYLQPYQSQSDESAFVYYSNVRIVELAPYILNQLDAQLVLSGSTVTLSSAATYASQNLTNTWVKGTLPTIGDAFTVTATVATDSLTGTNFIAGGNSYYGTNDTLTLNNVTVGTNYFAVWSDQAGSITSSVAQIEVVIPPANVTAAIGGKATFTVSGNGPSPLKTFQWSTNGVNLVNGAKYTNVATASLGVSNCTVGVDDAVTYACTVQNLNTNLVGLILNTNDVLTLTTPGASLTLVTVPSGATVAPAATNAVWGSPVTFTVTPAAGTPPFTYQWKKAGVNIANATNSTFTITNVTGITNSVSYTAGVTNGGGGTVSSAGVLTVSEPQPSISSAVSLSGGHVSLAFTSANGFDTTNGFILQSSTVVTGPYTNSPATFTTTGGGNFQITTPQTSTTNMFYRLLHAN